MSDTIKTIFPHTEAYIVLGEPGGGTNFIRNLISNLYYNNEFFVSDVGDAHDTPYDQNIDPKTFQNIDPNSNRGIEFAELKFQPIDEYKPIIFRTHNWHFALGKFFKKYPKGKAIIITNTKKDLFRLYFNVFIKNLIPQYEISNASIMAKWANVIRYYPPFANKEPFEISDDEIKTFLYSYQPKMMLNFPEDYYINAKFNDKVRKFRYEDIINEPNLILETLSNFVGKELNDTSYKNYEIYLAGQKKLINDRAPWILEYETNYSKL